ncbi:GNAT family N-acetyltransferase [Trinickia diaoshuihuensis]|uniref:GNAT family N-acetyltransferase n=1 Tax=Trinickia diaoshuihuensis TaxID=2292265 RepID=UPI000E2725FF|nr:GNAT family N-acetyltransferase [Trinickia diaoshuihuensis]
MSQDQCLEINLIESPSVTATEVAELYRSSGIRRPVDDLPRIGAMLRHANLVVGAYQDGKLVGLARAVTDFSYCCYLSDLAVSKEHQKQGIGKQLIGYIRERLGPQVMLLLLASPDAMTYYPGAGFTAVDNGWIIKRTS